MQLHCTVCQQLGGSELPEPSESARAAARGSQVPAQLRSRRQVPPLSPLSR